MMKKFTKKELFNAHIFAHFLDFDPIEENLGSII